MTLLNPLMLTGLLLLAVPVLIHFLNRSRFRNTPFGGMMFLHRAMRSRARLLKLRNRTLLAIRCLLLALITFALARPVFSPQAKDLKDQPTTHIVVLDDSFSMRNGPPTENAFATAKQQLLHIVHNLRPGDNMQIILGGKQPRPIFKKPVYDKAHIRQTVKRLQPATGSMDIPQSLKQAFWTADRSRLPNQQVYLLSDGQAIGWQAQSQDIWQELGEHQATLRTEPAVYALLQTPANTPPNIAITACRTKYPVNHIHRPTRFMVDIRNDGGSLVEAELGFSVDGQPQTTRQLIVSPGITTVNFEHHFKQPGDHAVTASITQLDSLRIDDKRSCAFSVLSTIRLLIVSSVTSKNPWLDDSALARQALGSNGDADSTSGLFEIDSKPESVLDTAKQGFLQEYDVAILADLPSLSDYAVFLLERFVEDGGGLLLAASEKASAFTYDLLYKNGKGILPAKLLAPQSYTNRFFRFSLLQENVSGTYAALGLTKAHTLEDTVATAFWKCQPVSAATTMATVGGAPFLVYKKYGKGAVILWTTSLNANWTNLPATPHYLPLLQSLTTALAAGQKPALNLQVGEPIPLESMFELAASQQPELEIVLPDNKKASVRYGQDSKNGGAWTNTSDPGIYTLAVAGKAARRIALRLPHSESNLTALTPDEKEMMGTFCDVRFYTDPTRFAMGTQHRSEHIEYWQLALGAAVLLLCLESYLNWRYSRQ